MTGSSTSPNQVQSNEIYKALFCQLYFLELKEFISNFDITPQGGNNSLNMGFLLEAYHHGKRTDYPQEMKWGVDGVDDAKLMLAIEEYFKITNKEITTNKDKAHTIKLAEERDDLFYLLFHNTENRQRQIDLGDQTLRLMFDYFGIKREEKQSQIGGLSQSFKYFMTGEPPKNNKKLPRENEAPKKYRDFWKALDLFAELRNWKQHLHGARFLGLELHLYHRYVVYTYIGFVYVCRQMWSEYQDFMKERCTINGIASFEMPPNTVTVRAVSPDKEISGVKIEEENNSNLPPIKIDTPAKLLTFEIEPRKYVPFRLVFKRGQKETLVPTDGYNELNYQSWFLSYDINLPSSIKPEYGGGEQEELSATLLMQLLGSLGDKDEDIREVITQELAKAKDLWVASVVHQSESDRAQYRSDLNKFLEKFKGAIDENQQDSKKGLGELKTQIQGITDSVSESLDFIRNDISEFNELTTKILKEIGVIGTEIKTNQSWIAWSFLFVIALLLMGHYTGFRKIDIILLWQEYKWVIGVLFIIPILSVILFALTYRANNLWERTKQIGKWQWLGIAGTAIPFMMVLGGLANIKSAINNYDFLSHDMQANAKAVEMMENYLACNPEDDENVRIKLAEYYLEFADDTERALEVTSPMLNDIEKYQKGILTIAQAIYSQGKDFWKVRDLLKIYEENVTNKDSNVVNRINGIMLTWGQGQESDVRKGNRLLKLSADNGDTEAQYYLGYSYSHEMTDWQQGRNSGTITYSECNLIDAINYLRCAASSKPKAALELGKIYSDLNMIDSAKCYLKSALSHSKGDLHKEVLYQLGLLLEKTKEGQNYMTKAAFLDYEPAILYKAYKAKDHKAAIELYNRSGRYHGYRYIPPVVFEYLALGQEHNALKALQEERPHGKFNKDFILGMEYLLKSPRQRIDSIQDSNQDSIQGMKLMKSSAEQGCLYAEMICIYREAGKKRIGANLLKRLEEIGDEIPFAFVLLSHLEQKEEAFAHGLPLSDRLALEAIGRGNFAGRLMLTVPPYYINFIKSTLNPDFPRVNEYVLYHLNIRLRALRWTPEKYINIFYGFKAASLRWINKSKPEDSLEVEREKQFWEDVSRANGISLNRTGDHHFESRVISDEISDSLLLVEFSDRIQDRYSDKIFY